MKSEHVVAGKISNFEEQVKAGVVRAEMKPGKPAHFLTGLMHLLSPACSDLRHVLSWSPNGLSFLIVSPDALVASNALKERGDFKHNNFPSLVRQLNMYGFHKHVSPLGVILYAQEYFRRDEPDLMRHIVRRVPTATGEMAPPKPPDNPSALLSDAEISVVIRSIPGALELLEATGGKRRKKHKESASAAASAAAAAARAVASAVSAASAPYPTSGKAAADLKKAARSHERLERERDRERDRKGERDRERGKEREGAKIIEGRSQSRSGSSLSGSGSGSGSGSQSRRSTCDSTGASHSASTSDAENGSGGRTAGEILAQMQAEAHHAAIAAALAGSVPYTPAAGLLYPGGTPDLSAAGGDAFGGGHLLHPTDAHYAAAQQHQGLQTSGSSSSTGALPLHNLHPSQVSSLHQQQQSNLAQGLAQNPQHLQHQHQPLQHPSPHLHHHSVGLGFGLSSTSSPVAPGPFSPTTPSPSMHGHPSSSLPGLQAGAHYGQHLLSHANPLNHAHALSQQRSPLFGFDAQVRAQRGLFLKTQQLIMDEVRQNMIAMNRNSGSGGSGGSGGGSGGGGGGLDGTGAGASGPAPFASYASVTSMGSINGSGGGSGSLATRRDDDGDDDGTGPAAPFASYFGHHGSEQQHQQQQQQQQQQFAMGLDTQLQLQLLQQQQQQQKQLDQLLQQQNHFHLLQQQQQAHLLHQKQQHAHLQLQQQINLQQQQQQQSQHLQQLKQKYQVPSDDAALVPDLVGPGPGTGGIGGMGGIGGGSGGIGGAGGADGPLGSPSLNAMLMPTPRLGSVEEPQAGTLSLDDIFRVSKEDDFDPINYLDTDIFGFFESEDVDQTAPSI